MKPSKHQVIIIGAGLAGLALAYFLRQSGHDFLLLEARERFGGRIRTSRPETGAPLELGATWFGNKHTALLELLTELGLEKFAQVTGGRAIYEAISTSPPQVVQLPPNEEPSYRIAGGTDVLVRALLANIPAECRLLETVVSHLTLTAEGLEVKTSAGTFLAERVVSTLPPRLLLETISIQPRLPEELQQIARKTHTWMGESIKVGLRYDQPFWRENGAPGGTIFSNVGPVSELYDHSSFTDDQFALKGFLNGAYHSLSRAERRDLVLHQLRKYYGPVVDGFRDYEEAVWRQEPYTFTEYSEHVIPHQHNGHPIFRETFLAERLLLAGAETAALFPGYMDGAVRSARRVSQLL